MELCEKVGLMRTLKGLTQEEMAAKLGMSPTGYAKIERGETKLQIYRLEKIAEILEMELKDLIGFDEKMIFNIGSFRGKSIRCQYYISSAVELTQELENMRVKLEAKDKENQLLQEQIAQLKEIIELMKSKQH
jgi:transcriptional regulator with XRE-family HTH domain